MVGSEARVRIVYFGTPDFAVAPLDALIRAHYEVVGVVTVADKPAGRGKKLTSSAVKECALARNLPLLQPTDLKSQDFLSVLRELRADLGVVVAFRKLPVEVYSIPPLGFFNLHASLLPQYRGAAPINWVLINGEKRSGVTTFLLNEQIDAGGMLLQEEVELTESTTAGELHDSLMAIGSDLVVRTVEGLVAGSLVPRPQDKDAQPRVAPKIYREDCRIDFTKTALQVHNLIRGLSPVPGAWATSYREGREPETVKFFSSRLDCRNDTAEIGLCRVSDGGGDLLVKCADGWLAIGEIQPAGKKRMAVREYLRGAACPMEFE